MNDLRISLLQMQPVSGDIDANLATIGQAAKAAAAMDARLLLTPELGVTGYNIPSGFAALAQQRDGAICTRLQVMADETGVAIVAGFPERDGAHVYNSVMAARPHAPAVFYRKCHLYGPMEQAAFAASDVLPEVFEIGGLKAGMLICYDVEFPEMVRTLALAGAELVLVPTALSAGLSGRHASQLVIPARAMENGVFLAYADLCGEEAGLVYEGGSVIAAPDGSSLARAGTEEALLVVTLAPSVYTDFRARIPYLRERRPEIYRL